MLRFIVFLFLVINISLNLHSEEIGRLPFRNFTHRDYLGHIQNWDAIQDMRGVMYFANNSGVLEFDGSAWTTISVNNSMARCLDMDIAGRIWVGGRDEFGYLAPDSLGQMVFISLKHMLPEHCIPFGMVRQVYATDNGVYFSTNRCLFKLSGNKVYTWLPKTFFHRTYHVGNKIYSIQPEIGLTVMSKDTMELVNGGEHFSNTLIYSILPFNKDTLLIATQSKGLFLLPSQIDNEQRAKTPIEPIPFKTANDDFLKNNWIYNGVKLPNGWYAYGTYRGGAVIIDQKGEVIQYIAKEQGIQDETVWHLTYDNQDNIWMALNNGISYSALKSPITSFDDNYGLQGVLQSVYKYGDDLYVSTNTGVFYLDGKTFRRVEGILELSWDIISAKSSDGKTTVLVGTGNGVYSLNNGMAKLIQNGGIPTFRLLHSKHNPDVIYLGHYSGFGVASYKNGSWHYMGRYKGVDHAVTSIAEDENMDVWYVNPMYCVVRATPLDPIDLKFSEKEEYFDLPNEILSDEDAAVNIINGEVKIAGIHGMAYFNSDSNSFMQDYSLGTEFAKGDKGLRIFGLDKIGNLWFESYQSSHTRMIERAVLREDGSFVRLFNEFNQIPRMIFYGVHTCKQGVTWIASADGLYRFDPSVNRRGIAIPRALIRKVNFGTGQLLFGGAFLQPCPDNQFNCISLVQESNNYSEISFTQNNIEFHFSSPFFAQEQGMKFSYKLEGFDDDWSEWTTNRHKEYTNLPFGNYKFSLKTLSVFDVESPVASYSFKILRPWYLHPLMFIAYLLLLVSLIVVSVTIKTQMLKASNFRLQNLVAERTREIIFQQQDILEKNEALTQQKEEILTQRDELDDRNKQTQASIQYALTIQKAILPTKKILDKYFENSILFMPKDVVSGDFYWFTSTINNRSNSERLFLALVDCTGHGVPGAFMSMIGSRMLSEIINERKIQDPAFVLTELNRMLNQVLHQDSTDNFDGMDISLCAFDKITANKYLVTFSGANCSLLYHKKGASEMSILRGNRKSIGGVLPNIDKEFDNKLIDLSEGDSLFLYSDGFTDQNNEFGKKYGSSRLNKLLFDNIDNPIQFIGELAEKSLLSFKKETSQRDDITLIGLRLK